MSKAWLALLSVGLIFIQQSLEFTLINNDVFMTLAITLSLWSAIDLADETTRLERAKETERRYRSGRYFI